MNGTYTAAVDRIVDGETAVILVEEDGEVIEQFDVAVSQLPEPAREDGGLLRVTISDGTLVEIEYDEKATTQRRESSAERLDRLSTRLRDRDSE